MVADGKLDGLTNSEVLQEILHVRLRRAGRKDAITAVRAATALAAANGLLAVDDADGS